MGTSGSDCILKGLRRATPDIWRTSALADKRL